MAPADSSDPRPPEEGKRTDLRQEATTSRSTHIGPLSEVENLNFCQDKVKHCDYMDCADTVYLTLT